MKSGNKGGKASRREQENGGGGQELNESANSGSVHVVSFEDSMAELDKTDELERSGSFQSETETVDLKKVAEGKVGRMGATAGKVLLVCSGIVRRVE